MAVPAVPEDQLIELLLTLKKTTPESVRTILNSQPHVAIALITLMVKMNAIDVNVFTKALSSFTPPAQTAPPEVPIAPAIPSHFTSQPRVPTPQTAPLPGHPPHQQYPPYQAAPYPPQQGPPGYQFNALPPHARSGFPNPYGPSSSGYGQPPPSTPTPQLPDSLATLPDDQKAMLMRLLHMPMEEVHRLPPSERAHVLQLRATLGLPTG